jgi:hypothetical protein
MAGAGTRRLADMTGSRTHALLCSGVRRRLHPWVSRRCSGWWDCGSCTACLQQRGLTECSAVTASRHRQGKKARTVPNPQQESPFGHSHSHYTQRTRSTGYKCNWQRWSGISTIQWSNTSRVESFSGPNNLSPETQRLYHLVLSPF